MGEFFVIGASHHTAPLDLRESLAVTDDAVPVELAELRRLGSLNEALLVSTCNRVEVYGESADVEASCHWILNRLAHRAARPDTSAHVYTYRGIAAVRHAYRVTSSLDSMVIGEPQILGQMKHFFSIALREGTIGTVLGRCFPQAFAVAKRVRRETAIASGSVSTSSIACELASKVFGNLEKRAVLLVGAGKMGEAAARKLRQSGARLTVVNRDLERAKQLAAQCGGEVQEYARLQEELARADVALVSTGSPYFVITAEMMKDVVRQRKRRPLFIIDISVPRNVDPRAGNMDNVFVYNIDDLQQVANENLMRRQSAAQVAEHIVSEEVKRFEGWLQSLHVTPTIVALRSHFEEIIERELERTLPRLGSVESENREALKMMGDAIVKKLLHLPLSELRKAQAEPEGIRVLHLARRLFALDDADGKDAKQGSGSTGSRKR